ncbi:MAG: RNase adapter protein RapZ [uncultured Rubrobacteraceae bacterium]|uniref:RNase adapter protein RapZ n=1 Tax=uncultured Rubrobacteraceae bacterium TaxID=349277 RepID=A0A6J4PQ74_9ACTN|nr:MAG: RNase adapter protein RapZ [uncultured Rubrobacteraceae bacterium]
MSYGAPLARGSKTSAGKRRVVVITGLSGAGKTNALKAFEDAGYYCIDNLPPSMISDVLALAPLEEREETGVVVVVDIRGRKYFGDEIEEGLGALHGEGGWEPQVIFIEADDPTLVMRYKESRRPHPAAKDGDVLAAIQGERRDLSGLREIADVVVDTSSLSAADSKRRFARLVHSHANRLSVSLISFGFKHGAPLDVDMLLDVRFLPNPHYDPELRPLTGHDEPVRDAVLGQKDTGQFLARLRDLLAFLIPRYAAEGKTYFTLGIGCTGGRHRSVAIVEDLARHLREEEIEGPAIDLFVRHRDVKL